MISHHTLRLGVTLVPDRLDSAMIDHEGGLLRRAADYQFGPSGGAALFQDVESLTVTRTSSGRPRQVTAEDGRLVSYGNDGRFTLGIAGGRRLHEAFEAPRNPRGRRRRERAVRPRRAQRVREVRRRGRRRDTAWRRGPESSTRTAVCSVVGRTELSGDGMRAFETGMAVKVRGHHRRGRRVTEAETGRCGGRRRGELLGRKAQVGLCLEEAAADSTRAR